VTRRDALLVLSTVVAVVLIVAWPLPRYLDSHLFIPLLDPDVQCGLWWPDAFVGSVLSGQDPFWRPELNYPEGQDVRLLVWNVFVQLLFLPLYAAMGPVRSLNTVALLVAILNGLASGWAGWMATQDRRGAFAGALVGAGTLFGLFECLNGRPEQGLWAPLAIYAGAWFGVLQGRRGMAVLAGVALSIAGATYWFYAVFGLLGTLPFAAWMAWRRELRPLLVAGAASLLTVLPFLLPIALGMGAEDSAYTTLRDTMDTVAQQTRASVAFPADLFGGLIGGADVPSTRFPLVLLPLALAGLVLPRTRALAAGTLAFAVLAAGPALMDAKGVPFADTPIVLPHAALNHLPGFSRFWWPYRWIAPAVVLLGLVAARLAARLPEWSVWVLGVVLVLDAKLVIKQAEVFLSPVAIPEALTGLQTSTEAVPVAAYPPLTVENGLVGLQPFHRQPIDAGLAWNETSALRGGWDQRAETGLLAGLSAIHDDREPGALEWGEFGAVVAFLPGNSEREAAALVRWLGPPDDSADALYVWLR